MLNANSNSLAYQPADIPTVEMHIKSAQTCHSTSKTQAATAAAYVYMVHRNTDSPHAHPDLKAWLNGQIEAQNLAIDQLNKERVTKKLPKLMRITSRPGANDFTKMVKFALGFRDPADSSHTSRYASAVGWLHNKLSAVAIDSVDQVAQAIADAGGFEAVIADYRRKGSAQNDGIDNAIAPAVAMADIIKASARVKEPIAIFPTPNGVADGLVLSLGRAASGQLQIVSSIPLPDDDADFWVPLFSDDMGPTKSASTSFFEAAFHLSSLVAEGRSSDITEDGTTAGAKLKEQRVITWVPDVQSGSSLVVSARYAKSSVVVKARPTLASVQLGKMLAPATLPEADGKTLQKLLSNGPALRFIDIKCDADKATWRVTKSAAAGSPSDNSYSWLVLGPQEHKPLDIDGYKPQFTVEVTSLLMTTLYLKRFADWARQRDPKKAKKQVSLRFADGSITYDLPGDESCEIACTGPIETPVTLKFRPKDLHDLFHALLGTKVEHFKLSGDPDGLLCVAWADAVGSYEVYLPTVGNNGELEPRRVVPMRVTLTEAAA